MLLLFLIANPNAPSISLSPQTDYQPTPHRVPHHIYNGTTYYFVPCHANCNSPEGAYHIHVVKSLAEYRKDLQKITEPCGFFWKHLNSNNFDNYSQYFRPQDLSRERK